MFRCIPPHLELT
jgi:hypothetical protein